MGNAESQAVLQLKAMATDRSKQPTVMVDNGMQVIYANRLALDYFGVKQENIPLAVPQFFARLANGPAMLEPLHKALKGQTSDIPVNFFIDAREFHGQLHAQPVLHKGTPTWCILSFSDESLFVRLQKRLTREEFFDAPTGLLNRKTFDLMLDLEIDKVSRNPENAQLAILILQIKNLETLRSMYKVQTVNLILEHLGNSLRTVLRSNDILFRYDDNRIVAIITQFVLKTDLLIVAERLDDQIAIPFHEGGTHIHLQATMGIAVYPDDGTTAESLTGNAMTALGHALEEGQHWLMFNTDIHERAIDRLQLRSGLSQAVKNNELELRFMTLVDKDGIIRGVESLLRWRHPERGVLTPDQFLPIALHSRIGGALTRWVLYRAIKDWEDVLSDYDVFVTINLSAVDLNDEFLLDTIKTATVDRMSSGRLKVEITESECIENIARTIEVIRALDQVDIEVMIDDFGVGHSSLSYLHMLPVTYAKVDRSFLRQAADNDLEALFLSHIIALAKVRGLHTILEGVEDPAQFEVLKASGAELYQGHCFGKPMTIRELEALLKDKAPRLVR